MNDIPSGIYFFAEEDNFYDAETSKGMGNDFYQKWCNRWKAFPKSADEASRSASGYVAVPVADLEKLEQARIEVYEMFPEAVKDTALNVRLSNITSIMWKLANTKWPTAT